jgi:serine/threonine protein kinase
VLSRDGAPNDVLLVRRASGQLAVLKRVRPDLRHREDLLLRHAQEGRILRELGRRHQLVGLAESYVDGEESLLLDFIDGGTLRERISALPRGTPAPLDLVARVAADVGEALTHLHEHDVVHRDVNPTNIVFDRDGRAWLIDLSVAAVGRPARGLSSEWEEDRVGTIPYSAPEAILAPNDPAYPSADLYALGVVLYELITGSRPFERRRDETPEDYARRVIASEPPSTALLSRAGPALAGRVTAMLSPTQGGRRAPESS